MKEKSEVILSGKWSCPVREFELVSTQSLTETIAYIEEWHQPRMYKRQQKRLAISKRKDQTDKHQLFLRRGMGQLDLYIDGEIHEDNSLVYITASARYSMGNMLMIGIIYAGWLVVSLYLTVSSLLVGSNEMLLFSLLFFILGFIIISTQYSILTRRRDTKIRQFALKIHNRSSDAE